MGGIFGVVSDKDASLDLFFGVDYHYLQWQFELRKLHN